MHTPSRRFAVLSLAALCLSPICGAAPVPPAAPTAPSAPAGPDKAQLKAQLDAREKRADLVRDELRASDDRIEATIDRVLDTLQRVGDSKDSRTKVARLKQETINRLQKNLAFYQTKRAGMLEEMRRPSLHLTVEEKQRYIAKLDARIEKRVSQILALNKSLPTHKDYEQYKAVNDGWYGTTYVQNEDYKQNKRLTSHTNTQRDEILKGLQRSIERLDQQNRSLQTAMAKAPTEAHRKMLVDEIAKNDALLKTRRAQLADTAVAFETPSRPISGKEAQDLDMALRKAVDSLQREFTTLFQRISTYMVERSNVNAAKAALEAMK